MSFFGSLGGIFRRVLKEIAERLPKRTIYERSADDVYLERYYLFGQNPTMFPEGMKIRLGWLPFTVFLHHFRRSDNDVQLHNHPWPGISLILTGGYSEERRVGFDVIRRDVWPGSINRLGADTFHRVDLYDHDFGCWTLFAVGKKQQSWGFWDRDTGIFTPWREHLGLVGEERQGDE